MRLVIARCSVDYSGRLNAHLPLATRLLVHKGDGSLLVHSDGGSYKPLNWMSPPCSLATEVPGEEEATAGVVEVWRVTHKKTGDALRVQIYEIIHDSQHELGIDPGLQKDGVEADLQRLLAEQVELIAEGATLVRREYPTAIGPVDLLVRDAEGAAIALEVKRRGDIDGANVKPHAYTSDGGHIAVEVKRKANIDAVEQLTRYLELLNRDPHLRPVRGILAAQSIALQARTLANDRGIEVLLLDYEAMKGVESGVPTLF
ncbi:endonuclease NucS [Aneurinibacillus sp. BA2021]|nr:endonuclease NucS [Aneurinibacillus sp. BA2021]